ncbi:MAG: hypothetical protein AB1641_24380 [Thermodesulfobacteriota bacterium]
MFPSIFEWDWSLGRLIFMGLLYLVLAAIGLGLTVALVKTMISLKGGARPGGQAGH